MENSVELLAPAGSEENFYGAINFGANAIYLGLSDFSARKNASNFTLEKLPYFVAYAHLFNVKVYVTVNTVIKNSEINKYFEFIEKAYKCGVDAFIVQDIFLGRRLKNTFNGITLHLSTQAGINNVDGAKQALSYGFSRVILARETNINEIKKIASIIETEVFVHGALCTSLSGHCYFSSFIGGNSGNRGLCKQPCRKLYKYEGKNIKDQTRYALSLADLSLASYVQQLITAGVKSFKIEGRMRSFEYVCAACDLYSDAINGRPISKVKFENLKRTYNRGGYTEGYIFGQHKNLISDKIQNHAGSIIASVSAVKGSRLTLSGVKHSIKEGDSFKILSGGKEIGNAVAISENGKIAIQFRHKAFIGSEIAITKDVLLIEKYKQVKKLYPVTSIVYARENEKLKLTVNGKEYISDFTVTQALTSAVTKGELKDNLRKTDVYPFSVTPSCDIVGNLFIPKKVINNLRAAAYSDLFYSFSGIKTFKNQHFTYDFENDYTRIKNGERQFTVISCDFGFNNFSGLKNLVFCPEDYNDQTQFDKFFSQTKKFNCEKYLYLPAFINAKDEQIIASKINAFDGVYCEGASGLFFAKRHKKKFFGGIELNVTNNLSYEALACDGATQISISKELSFSEIEQMKEGWCLTFGDIKVMSLIYCPFNRACKNCTRGSNFILKDADGRQFKVRRYKLSECRFEIYNESLLKSKRALEKEIFDFTTLNNAQINQLLSNYLLGEGNLKYNFTSGNLLKGVE